MLVKCHPIHHGSEEKKNRVNKTIHFIMEWVSYACFFLVAYKFSRLVIAERLRTSGTANTELAFGGARG